MPGVCLIVLDGWGIGPPGAGNAISLANTPVFDELWASCPRSSLSASGPERRAARWADGQLGGGPPHAWEPERWCRRRSPGSTTPSRMVQLAENGVLCSALTAAPRVHLLGLSSDGGVHSQLEHMRAVIELAAGLGTSELVIHCITDGRDTSPSSGAEHLGTVERWCAHAGLGRVASVVGRYFAMDRDGRWERTQSAYDLLVHGRAAHHVEDAPAAAREAYLRGESDEFITATLVGEEGRMRAGDSVLCLNFRARPHAPDSARPRRARVRRGRRGAPRLARPRGRPAGGPTRHDDSISAGLAVSKRVHRGPAPGHARGGDLARGHDPAARRRDREVRARHVLLQRRCRAAAARRTS